MELVKMKCDSMGVDYWNLLSVYRNDLAFNYLKNKNRNEILRELYRKNDYNSIYLIKNLMQNHYIMGKLHCLKVSENEFNEYSNKLFSWLDSVENPYFFIFQPVWHYSTRVYERGYYPYKEKLSGVSLSTIEIAVDYASYKLNKKTLPD
ncbi:hypothetical protein Phi13:2_gp102 [Cellulophaga phage phi13:2]|uniref:Uncharacterized protein n=1 Tax=Cellulophaga phage phi13:2 TaxID=1328030 RepID=S0A5Q4_9CAUD|nr:hypothetical protein Phi13:2_gp102 [Cellulophaga phage phi13:2]AGO49712.1 hypothetical protein Phi13:2_gp102 [Cellulophaga phage phi13:2]